MGHALVEYEEGKILAFYPNCSLDEIKDYVTKIRNDKNYGDLEFVFFKKDDPSKEEKVDVYLSKGIQKNKLFKKSNPTDCKVIYHNLDY